MPHKEWATKVQREVYEHWEESYKDEDDWEHGVKVFYSPVHSQTDLLVLGYQPGGRGKGEQHSRFEAGDFTPPEQHHYITKNWDLAEAMRELFDGHEDVLSDSVASNIVFFSSPDANVRKGMKDFCWEYIENLVDRVDPEMILTFGVATFDEVTDRMGLEQEVILRRPTDRLLLVSDESNPKVVGMIHPTGAQISTEDRSRTYDQTRELLADNKIIEQA